MLPARIASLALLVVLAGAAPARAELNQTIVLTDSPNFLATQNQSDGRWGQFPVGPSNKVVPQSDPAKVVNIARCGCLLTSLSTTIEGYMAGGSVPWFSHSQFSFNGFEQKLSFSPKYLDDFLNVGPNPSGPRSPGWGFLEGSGGTNCATGVKPWAATNLAQPLNSLVAPTGVTWSAEFWDAASRAAIDAALLKGRPSIVMRNIVSGSGKHANLIVGWNNATKRYLIYDPLWEFSGPSDAGTNYQAGATAEERYANWFAAVRTVLVPEPVYSPSLWMRIVAFGDPAKRSGRRAGAAAPAPHVRLRLTDPRGHRTGYDPASGQMLDESTSASYEEFTSFADPLGVFDEAPAVPLLAARDPEPGTYALEVFGTRTGPFTLQLAGVNGDSDTGATTIAGTIAAGATKRYEVVRAPGGSQTATEVAAFGPRARAGNDGSGYAGVGVAFDGRGSNQPGGAIASHAWDFGDGGSATGAQATHAYAAPGTYVATLTVTGPGGRQATDTRTITIVPAPVVARETIRASVDSAGNEANSGSAFANVSPDGRFVTFDSFSTNLVGDDSNGVLDIFLKDLSTGAVERVNVADDEAQASDGYSAYSSLSDDGRYIAFQSSASNLGGSGDSLYLRDRQAGTTTPLAQLDSSRPRDFAISGDGRYIVLRTSAVLSAADVNGPAPDLYLRDRVAGTWEFIGFGSQPAISADGRFVAYRADGATDDDETSFEDIYVLDRQAGTTSIATLTATGSQLTAHGFNPSISADGRYVAFNTNTTSPDLPIGSPTGRPDVLVRDLQLATTEKVNADTFDAGAAILPSISSDGRYVAFVYGADMQLSTPLHVHMRDRLGATTDQMSVATDGSVASPSGASNNTDPSVTNNGSVLFVTSAANLVTGDANGAEDVFLRRPLPSSGGQVAPLANLGGPYSGWATSAAVPSAIRFDASKSLDPAGRALTATWSFGDGTAPVDGPLVLSHAYAVPGVYEVTVTVKAGADTSTPLKTTVEVLPALPAASLAISACASPGGELAIDGAAPAANAALIAQGWDTSAGAPDIAPVSVTLPWGSVQATPTLPSLAFARSVAVPGGQSIGAFSATVPGAAGPFHLPCATAADRPPLADAGGPTYSGAATVPVTLDGTRSSDPEGAALTYRWNFGDGTTGTGATPSHTYPAPGAYLATLQVNDGANDSLEDIGTRSFALVVVGAAPPAGPGPGPGPVVTPVPSPGPAPVTVAADARCANGQLRLIDVYPDGKRVRIRGVAPVAARGQTVAITFAATGKVVARAVVAADLSFATTAPLPAARLRASNRARYTAAVAGAKSAALKLTRRMYLQTVARTAAELRVTGQVVKPLARARRDRAVTLRITTTCGAAGGRTVTVSPSAAGAFKATVKLTAAERTAPALYVRGHARVRRSARSRALVRTATLVRGA